MTASLSRASSDQLLLNTQLNTGRFRSRAQPSVAEAMAKKEDRTEFYGSQVGGQSVINYSYTDNPWQLLMHDIKTFFHFFWALPWIVWPVRPCPGGNFDELSFTCKNVFCIFVHTILVILQLVFILTLPMLILFPIWSVAAYLVVFFSVNWLLCRLLNGSERVYVSDSKYAEQEDHPNEKWVFLNGVAVGEDWLLSNINRLALTFKRQITGIHNKTDGILFDVVECLIQRNFTYATTDVRVAYKELKQYLYDPQFSKVVFILHSQGGIEGGMVLDWLLQELPQDLLSKLEVYTFGCAANHFNNPHRHEASRVTEQNNLDSRNTSTMITSSVMFVPLSDSPVQLKSPALSRKSSQFTNSHTLTNGETSSATQTSTSLNGNGHAHSPAVPSPTSTSAPNSIHFAVAAADRAIGYIEHYAHTTDFVALWGVLHFVTNELADKSMPRFMGRVFSRDSSRGGHQFSQHYLNGMFALARDSNNNFVGCADTNGFMESVVEQGGRVTEREGLENNWAMLELAGRKGSSGLVKKEVTVRGSFHGQELDGDGRIRVKNLSRLWLYRNGRNPPEVPKGLHADADGIVRAGTL